MSKMTPEERKRKIHDDKLRSSCLYDTEVLYVIYTGKASNFPKDIPIKAIPRCEKQSGLPYPQPKWIACSYYITDLDGDRMEVARERFGELEKGFEWIEEA